MSDRDTALPEWTESDDIQAIIEYAETYYGRNDSYDELHQRLFAMLVVTAKATIAEYVKSSTNPLPTHARREATWSVLQGLVENLSDQHIQINAVQVAIASLPADEHMVPPPVVDEPAVNE